MEGDASAEHDGADFEDLIVEPGRTFDGPILQRVGKLDQAFQRLCSCQVPAGKAQWPRARPGLLSGDGRSGGRAARLYRNYFEGGSLCGAREGEKGANGHGRP
jgi:hypothetical protein